ncbi:MAG: hypothetical protein ACRCYU_06520 [Nocardioides sp.]
MSMVEAAEMDDAVLVWQLRRAGEDAVWVELTTGVDLAVLRVDAGGQWLTVAQACVDEAGCWRVRALLAGHEEVVGDEAGMCACMLADLHELFAGSELVEVAV